MQWLHRVRWGPALEGLLDDELDHASLERVLSHLEDCPGCLAELEALARLQRALERVGATPLVPVSR